MIINRSGFSLIEVILFIGILAVFFVTGMGVLTFSIQSMKISEHKIIASQYAEELMQWIKTVKEADWKTFYDSYSSDTGKAYCFNIEPVATWPVAPNDNLCTSANTPFGTPTIFQRSVILSRINPNQVQVKVTVEWNDAGKRFYIPLITVLSLWE